MPPLNPTTPGRFEGIYTLDFQDYGSPGFCSVKSLIREAYEIHGGPGSLGYMEHHG